MKKGSITEAKCSAENFATDASKYHVPGIIDTVHMAMVDLEDTHNIIRPGRDDPNGQHNDDTGYQA